MRPRQYPLKKPLQYSLIALAACASAPSAHAAVNWNINASGAWTIPTNWSSNPALPGAADDVTINQPGPATITVTLGSGTQSIHSLVDDNTLTLAGGSLSVASTMVVNGVLNINGGTLQNASLSGLGSFNANAGIVSNVTLTAATLFTGSNLTLVAGNLTLNSSTYYAGLNINNSETLGGSGALIFNGSYGSGSYISYNSGSPTLTVASGIALQTGTGNGTIVVPTLINLGTISAQTAGTSININDTTFTNNGNLKALNGGTLFINATTWSSNGTITLDNTSTVDLGGTFTTANIGTISRTGGTINITGTLDNTNSNLLLNAATGSFVLVNNATIKNGTVSTANGSQLIISGGTLSNVTLANDLTVTASTLFAGNNLTLSASNLTLNSSTYYASININNNETLAGTGTLIFNGTYGSGSSLSYNSGNPTLTIASGITVQTGTGNGTTAVPTLINLGTISAQTAGTSIAINGITFTNNGTLKALNGATLNIAPSASWSNSGTITLDNLSTVNLGGTFTTANIGTISRTGGTINITGTLDNTASNLLLNTATGSFVLVNNATIKNGTISTANGSQLIIANGTLSNVTLANDLTVTASTLFTNNNLTLSASNLTLNSSTYYSNINIGNTETLAGTGAVIFNGTYGSGSSLFYSSGSPTLTIASGITLETGNGNGTLTVPTLVNLGTISAQTNAASININDTTFTNAGTLKALNGGTLFINPTASWSSNGTIMLDSTSTVNLGGTFTTANIGTISRTGGTINITGTLDNTGSNLLLNAATGSFVLFNGTIKNGTVSAANAAQLLITAGTLNNVTLATDVNVTAVTLSILNNLTLSSSNLILNSSTYYGNLNINNTETIGGTGAVIFNGTYGSGSSLFYSSGSPTLTVGPGVTLQTGTGPGATYVPTLINLGIISAQTSGTTFTIADTTFTNLGTVQALNGANVTITPIPTNFTAGTLTGGTWNAFASSSIILPFFISTNAANITLSGAGSNFYTSAAQTASSLSLLGTNAGTLTITGGRSFTGQSSFINTGTLIVGPSSTFGASNLTLNAGTLAGSGTVSANVFAGSASHTIAPGLPGSTTPAALTLTTLLTNANTTLAFDITSPTANDLLIISASHGLTFNGGTLQINPAAFSVSTLGYYKIIQYTSAFTGPLNALTITSSFPAYHFSLDTLRDPGFIDIHLGLIGDANDDGKVDLTDLNTVLNNLGTTQSSWNKGNFDGAASIDLTDLNDVLNNLGTSFANPSPASPAAPTPEPASLLTLSACAVSLLSRRSAARPTS